MGSQGCRWRRWCFTASACVMLDAQASLLPMEAFGQRYGFADDSSCGITIDALDPLCACPAYDQSLQCLHYRRYENTTASLSKRRRRKRKTASSPVAPVQWHSTKGGFWRKTAAQSRPLHMQSQETCSIQQPISYFRRNVSMWADEQCSWREQPLPLLEDCSQDAWHRRLFKGVVATELEEEVSARMRNATATIDDGTATGKTQKRSWRLSPQRARPSDHCAPAEHLWQCDSHAAPLLSRVWQSVGTTMPAKLTGKADREAEERRSSRRPGHFLDSHPFLSIGKERDNASLSPVPDHPEWIFCADAGEVCLCSGQVRFRFGDEVSSEVLYIPRGILGCKASYFGMDDAMTINATDSGVSQSPLEATPRWCECQETRPAGPLLVPGLETTPAISEQFRQASLKPQRFIRGTKYPDAFRNGLRYDYASLGAGARLVTHASGLRHASSVLKRDVGEYLLTLCETRSWFVVSLLEDLFLEHIGLVSLEFFASGFRHLQILGSSKYPTDQWRVLGEIETSPTATHELFDIGSSCRQLEDACWVSFLKVRVLSHHQIEDNSYCALTQFQAFGSTQMTYIAEEIAETKVDPRFQPSVADALDWHEQAVQQALAGKVSEAEHVELGIPMSSFSTSSFLGLRSDLGMDGTPQDGLPDFAGRPGGSDLDSNSLILLGSGGKLMQKWREQFPPLSSPLSSVVSTISSLLKGRLPQQMLPEPPHQVDPAGNGSPSGEEERPLGSDVQRPEDPKGDANASQVDRTFLSLTEVLASLNATGMINADPDASGKLRNLLAALQGGAGDTASLSALAGESANAQSQAVATGSVGQAQGQRPPSKSSASTPALVRIHNDLREVQDGQAALQENIKSVTSGMGHVLMLILEMLEDHSSRVRKVEVASTETAHSALTSGIEGPFSLEDIANMLQEGIQAHSTSFFVKAVMMFLASWSVDRLLILLLFVYIVFTRKPATVPQVGASTGATGLSDIEERRRSSIGSDETLPDADSIAAVQQMQQGGSRMTRQSSSRSSQERLFPQKADGSAATPSSTQRRSALSTRSSHLQRLRVPSRRTMIATATGAQLSSSSEEVDGSSPLNLSITMTDFGTARSGNSTGSSDAEEKGSGRPFHHFPKEFQQVLAQGSHGPNPVHRLAKRGSSMARRHRAPRKDMIGGGDPG